MSDAAAIVGIGETPFARNLDDSEKRLATRAILTALDDAGVSPAEVDGLASYTMESTNEVEIAKNPLGDFPGRKHLKRVLKRRKR